MKARLLAVVPLLALAVLSGTAQAASGPPALSTHLLYRTVSWHGDASDPDGEFAGVSVAIPRRWYFVLTADKQGRVSDPTHTWLLTVQWPEHGHGVRAEIREQVQALKGTEGLRILHRGVAESDQHRVLHGTLTYRYVDGDGEARRVSYRYDGSTGRDATAIVAVAGRPRDAAGLRVLLAHTVHTLRLAG